MPTRPHPPATVTEETAPASTTAKIDTLASRLLEIELELNSNIPTTLWISDLHGEGDRFKSILRGRFGMLYQTCREALPSTFSVEKVQYLTRIIRKQQYLKDDSIRMDMQDVILCLVDILKYKMTNIRPKNNHLFKPEFRDIISRMLAGLPVPDPVFEEELIANRLIAHLSFAIRQILLDRIQVLGDVFDRGEQPDKILRILSSSFYRNGVDYVFGNHDILWMGAAAGCASLAVEAMRITCRYDHFSFLERLCFSTEKLEQFAVKTYPPEKITGNFKAKSDKGRAMEKALAIIQFKLEEKTITQYPHYEMQSRLWLEKLGSMLKSGGADLNDTWFPTINAEAPATLTSEEQEIVDDLVHQFTTNHKLMRLLKFLFEHGSTYHIHNNFLNIHALVPSTESGEFEEFLGRSGKHLLNFIQQTIYRVGQNYLAGRGQKEEDQALFFYLWCGPKSPFFGKHAMKTFERYFLLDKKSHEERTLYWHKNLRTEHFKKRLLDEFGVKRVVFGHTPVNYKKGARMASSDGVAINVDGGFAAAYYNRGHSLVHTPFQIYGIILPTPEEITEAERRLESAPLDVELIDEFPQPMKIKDTSAGRELYEERDRLMKELVAAGGKTPALPGYQPHRD